MTKQKLFINKFFLAGFIFLSLCPLSFAQTNNINRVIDGDTILLANGERVRLIGIDTPESKINDKAKRDSQRTGQDLQTIIEMGERAKKYLEWLMSLDLSLRIEFDAQTKDKYGRLLGYVFLEDTSGRGREILADIDPFTDGAEAVAPVYVDQAIFVNATIIKAGYASPMTIPPNVRYADLFKKLYAEARENKRGLWKDGN